MELTPRVDQTVPFTPDDGMSEFQARFCNMLATHQIDEGVLYEFARLIFNHPHSPALQVLATIQDTYGTKLGPEIVKRDFGKMGKVFADILMKLLRDGIPEEEK